jgi:hypothetical protein
VLLPEIGLPDTFPWLQYTIFADQFVSHHYGFHAYLVPWVYASHALTGDYIPGARWAMSFSFGLMLAACMALLRAIRVPWRGLWLMLLVMLPADFYIRHAYVRAIDLSLFCLLVGMWCLARRRYLWLAVVILLYTHLYLGSFFLVAIAGFHFVSGVFARRPRWDWRLFAWVVVGLAAGLITHPYFPEHLAFLKTQIFGTGLTPSIGVGREWYPYDDTWKFIALTGVPLGAFVVSMVVRLRLGPRLSRFDWTLLITNLFFLTLALKARRFIEYWPVFGVISAAGLAAPVLRAWIQRLAPADADDRSVARLHGWRFSLLMLVLVAAAGGMVAWAYQWRGQSETLLAWWWVWLLLAALYAVVRWPRRAGSRQLVVCGLLAVILLSTWTVIAGPVLGTVRRWAKGKYHGEDLAPAMAYLQEHAAEGDIVFTEDWDSFTAYFYYNHKVHYIYGLDPVFGLEHDPELWERFVKITRGQAPTNTKVRVQGENGTEEREIRVEREDIRDEFGARWVIADDDHLPMIRRLERVPDLARKVYPPVEERPARGHKPPPYTIFEILPEAGDNAGDGDGAVGDGTADPDGGVADQRTNRGGT